MAVGAFIEIRKVWRGRRPESVSERHFGGLEKTPEEHQSSRITMAGGAWITGSSTEETAPLLLIQDLGDKQDLVDHRDKRPRAVCFLRTSGCETSPYTFEVRSSRSPGVYPTACRPRRFLRG
jgi:hypothetical protein